MNWFQRLAQISLICLLVLIVVGAIVRVTGSGMGCPDWPKCWGKLVPPSSLEEIDVDALVTNEAFIREWKSEKGEDAELTADGLREMFNPQHTWTEYINRLFAMPIGLASLALFIVGTTYRKKRPVLFWGSFSALLLVLLNAVMGMMVVKTGLKPGVITVHMALALLLVCVLVYLIWNGGESVKRYVFQKDSQIMPIAWFLFIALFVEGVLGSQVREMTDALQKSHGDAPRSEWVAELEQTWMYIVHRSFSWVIMGATIWFYWMAKQVKGIGWVEQSIAGIVLAQMVLGLVMANLGVFPVVQVLHISLSSFLLASMFYWLLCGCGRSVPGAQEKMGVAAD